MAGYGAPPTLPIPPLSQAVGQPLHIDGPTRIIGRNTAASAMLRVGDDGAAVANIVGDVGVAVVNADAAGTPYVVIARDDTEYGFMQVQAGLNIFRIGTTGGPDTVKLDTAANKVGFLGHAPVGQQAAIADLAASGAIYTQAADQALRDTVTAIRNVLRNFGFTG